MSLIAKTQPAYFVIYAHDTKSQSADSRVVRDIIRYMKLMDSPTRSDRVAILRSEDPESEARDDILANQFCLLPEQIATNPVKKVLLFYSRVLRDYCTCVDGSTYVKDLKDTALNEIQRLRSNDTNTIILNTQRVLDIQTAIRAAVNRHTRKPWFHHVLTEIALLDLRVLLSKQPLKVIPVDLQSTDTVLEDLSFLNPTQHYVVPPPPIVVKVDAVEQTHKLLFNLLERIHGQLPPVALWLQELYTRGIEKLEENRSQADVVFRDALWLDIRAELWRAHIGGLRQTPWSQRQTERGDQEWDIPFFNLEPAKPIITPPPQVIPELLVPPTEEQKRILQTLLYYEMDRRIHEIEDPFPNTLEWLFHHTSYSKWLSEGSGMLGIRGGPGTGKSTAIKAMIQREQSKSEPSHLLLYFFFHGRGGERSKNRVGMYQTLLFQLLNKVPSAGINYWQWAKEIGPEHLSMPSNADTLREMFLDALFDVCTLARVRVFLDALDEAGDEEAREVIADLRRISTKVGLISRGLSICFACRYYPTIVVDNGLEIKLEDYNKEDIGLFIQSSLKKLSASSFNGDEEKLDRLVTAIDERSSGFFLWAKLAVGVVKRSIEEERGIRNILQRITEQPAPIQDLYSHMLAQTLQSEGGRNMTLALIRWIRFSFRPMTLEELRYALSWDQSLDLQEDAPSKLCQPTVDSDTSMLRILEQHLKSFTQVEEVVDANGQVKPTVQFIHHTVYEFFSDPRFLHDLASTSTSSSWFGQNHDMMAQTCYNFIKSNYNSWFELGRNEIQKLPFCDYAAQFCFVHAEQAASYGISQDFLLEQLGHKAERDALMQWAKVYGAENLAERSLSHFPTWHQIAKAFKLGG
ncbi:uncharacterized protein LY89DRAFT_53208 [Mollisia scopiformis]|uniref:Nephrocystin 3-like N-terminal domain-containing protein n=1 Tax=Mollisia scopiformis TaxID=149040 RepID=A0A194XB77_MOLSC|nr:uncharacterized protein LY89DRAFT_53208 [Mollisia scopiformis]KUJ17421.1 hypothetical protein LY89DRAFT_53208 [Mollisia scopiformis]